MNDLRITELEELCVMHENIAEAYRKAVNGMIREIEATPVPEEIPSISPVSDEIKVDAEKLKKKEVKPKVEKPKAEEPKTNEEIKAGTKKVTKKKVTKKKVAAKKPAATVDLKTAQLAASKFSKQCGIPKARIILNKFGVKRVQDAKDGETLQKIHDAFVEAME